jgi:hypothetical protein
MYWIQIVGKSRDIINIVPADRSAGCTATYNIDVFGRAELLLADAPRGALQCHASNTMPAREVLYRAARRATLAPAAYVTDNLCVNYLLNDGARSQKIGVALSIRQVAHRFFSGLLACGSLNPISSGVFFMKTTSFPRDKKLL